MNPYQRLSWTLGLSLIIWAPIALGVLGNTIDVTKGTLYYLGALLFSWFGTGVIERLANNYRHTQESLARAKREIERIERRAQLEKEAEEDHRRRSTDN